MKYAIMSDAHANPLDLARALEDARRQKCERFVFLGDTTGYGYDAKGALDLVRASFDVALMGNHDSACLNLEPAAELLFNPNYAVDIANRDVLTPEDMSWLRARPYHYVCEDFACAHANMVDPQGWDYILDGPSAIIHFLETTAPLVFCGHTHLGCVWRQGPDGSVSQPYRNVFVFDHPRASPLKKPKSYTFALRKGYRYIVNCGSVGYPRNDFCSTYAIFNTDSRRVTLRRLPFDFADYQNRLQASGVEPPAWLIRFNDRQGLTSETRTR